MWRQPFVHAALRDYPSARSRRSKATAADLGTCVALNGWRWDRSVEFDREMGDGDGGVRAGLPQRE